MDCTKCDRLMAEDRHRRLLYASAVELFFASGWKASDAEYARLKNAVEETRTGSEIARFKLSQHKLTHPES